MLTTMNLFKILSIMSLFICILFQALNCDSRPLTEQPLIVFYNFSTMENNNNKISFFPKPFSSIPGPWLSLPWIGTGWQYLPLVGRYTLDQLHESYLDKFLTYGPLVKDEYKRGKVILHLYDPADFETVFRNSGPHPHRPPSSFACKMRASKPHLFPDVGIHNLNGPEWAQLRRLTAHSIMPAKAVNEMMDGQNEVAQSFVDYLWDVARDGETSVVQDILQVTYRLAIESLCLMCLNSRVGSFENSISVDSQCSDGEIMIKACKTLLDTKNKLHHFGIPLWKYWTTQAYSEMEDADSQIYGIISKYVERAMAEYQDEQLADDSNRSSVLRTLLKKEKLHQKQVKATIADFIHGGIFPLTFSMAYIIYHLAENPRVQEKLYDEIKSVLKEKEGDSTESFGQGREVRLSTAQLSQMSYLKACFTEMMRINCSIAGLTRLTTQPLVLSGYDVPANSLVYCHSATTSRLENYFENALEFRPERWIEPESKASINPFAVIPFGCDSRVCPGKRFSEAQLQLSIARLIQAYRLELAPGCEQLEVKHAYLLIPAKPISVRITRR